MSVTPTLVLLHHFGGSARSWHAVRRLLPGHSCLIPDLPGFGRAAGAPGPFSVAAQADHVAGLIAANGVHDHILVGHSMGGKIALALAARAMPGLRALVLLAPSPPTPEPIEDDNRARLIAGWGDRASAERILKDALVGPLSAELRARTLEDILRSSQAAWRHWLECGSREDLSSLLGSIKTPVSILSGDGDKLIPGDLLRRELVDRLALAGLSILAGAGHLLPIESPREVAAFIMSAADQHRTPVSRQIEEVNP